LSSIYKGRAVDCCAKARCPSKHVKVRCFVLAFTAATTSSDGFISF
jgi:hypothetical protein